MNMRRIVPTCGQIGKSHSWIHQKRRRHITDAGAGEPGQATLRKRLRTDLQDELSAGTT
jgi:hypothetical protein